MKVLAVGATGPNAGLVVPELVKRGVEVRALVRADGKADAARQRGATEIAVGDLGDPGSLRAAVAGVEGVFHQWADAAKLPDGPMRDGFKRMYAEYDQHGFAGGNALILRSILGREPRTLRAYIEELASP